MRGVYYPPCVRAIFLKCNMSLFAFVVSATKLAKLFHSASIGNTLFIYLCSPGKGKEKSAPHIFSSDLFDGIREKY